MIRLLLDMHDTRARVGAAKVVVFEETWGRCWRCMGMGIAGFGQCGHCEGSGRCNCGQCLYPLEAEILRLRLTSTQEPRFVVLRAIKRFHELSHAAIKGTFEMNEQGLEWFREAFDFATSLEQKPKAFCHACGVRIGPKDTGCSSCGATDEDET